MYTVWGIYRHPMAMCLILSPLQNIHYTNRAAVLAGDINIYIIKFFNEAMMSYIATLMFKYLLYITAPSRITQLSTTCMDYCSVWT